MTHARKIAPDLQTKMRGEEIRAKIEANRQRRLAIAEAMKAEAGVTSHELNNEGEGGLAYLNTGVILSPQGRNMRQLYTVAHECGHIFLHRDDYGKSLPAHVQEMEAEIYANQAFLAHGMTLPPELTAWGRQYVGTWIESDTQKGLQIEPAAQAYAAGQRSPFTSLRRVPASWLGNPNIPRPSPVAVAVPSVTARQKMRVLESGQKGSALCILERLWSDLCDWSRFAGRHWLYGAFLCNTGLSFFGRVPYVPQIAVIDPSSHVHSWPFVAFYISAGIAWAFAASLLRTMWKR